MEVFNLHMLVNTIIFVFSKHSIFINFLIISCDVFWSCSFLPQFFPDLPSIPLSPYLPSIEFNSCPPIKGNLCGILFAGVGLTTKVDYMIKESSLSFYRQLSNVSRCSARCETHTSAFYAGILYGLSAYKFCVCCLNSYEFICMTVLLCLKNIVSL